MPPRLRDTGNGLINAGWAAGALMAPFVVAPIVAAHGWKASFLVTGGICFLWLPLWMIFAFRSNRLASQPMLLQAGSDNAAPPMQWRSKALWAALLAIFFTVPPTVFANSLVPIFLKDTFGLDTVQSARYTWQPFLATDIGQLIGGLLVYVLLRQGLGFLGARRIVISIGFIGAVVIIGLARVHTVRDAMACLDVSRFFFQIGYCALLAYAIESVAENQTAKMAGLTNATFAACNFVFSPLIGHMIERYHGYKQVALLLGVSPILGLACWWILSSLHARQMTVAAQPAGFEPVMRVASDSPDDSRPS